MSNFNGNCNFRNNGNNHHQFSNQSNNQFNNRFPQQLIAQHQHAQAQQPVQPQGVRPPFQFNQYLNEVNSFCCQSGLMKIMPRSLSIQAAMQICFVADRLKLARLEALKTWKVSNSQVVISPKFLAELFYSRNMLNKKVSEMLRSKVSDLVLMNALREQFPELLIGIICQEEVPVSKFSKIKSLAKANPFLIVAVLTAVALGIWFQFSTIYLSLVAITGIFFINKHKRLFNNRFLSSVKSAIMYAVKMLHSFIGSCIVSSDNNTSIPKTTKLNTQPEQEEMYLDLECLEVVKPKSAYNTTPLKHTNNTKALDESNKTNILDQANTSFIN